MSEFQEAKMSQGQQVRAQAFFMAQNRQWNRGEDPPTFGQVLTEAEKVEEWLWQAQEGERLRQLLAAVDDILELRFGARPTNEVDALMNRLAEAADPLRSALPTKKVRR